MAKRVTPKSVPAPRLIKAHSRSCEVPSDAPKAPPLTAKAKANVTYAMDRFCMIGLWKPWLSDLPIQAENLLREESQAIDNPSSTISAGPNWRSKSKHKAHARLEQDGRGHLIPGEVLINGKLRVRVYRQGM